MSLSEISKSIDEFFTNKDPIIFCLSGRWGIGKTFLFDKQSKKYNERIKESLPNIKTPSNLIKISLFGLGSLDEIKHNIFAEIESIKLISKTLNITSDLIKNKINLNLEKQFESFFLDKYFNNLSLCFDDLERKSPSLKIIDLLGFVSMLKEKYQCKIFLIVNDDMLQGDDKNDYNKYFEKVVDHHIKYISQSVDSTEIVCKKYHDNNQLDEDVKNLLKEKIKILNINNIRIIDKIFSLSNLLLKRLKKSITPKIEKETIDNTLIALCLFCDGIYFPDSCNNDKPKINDILNPENKIYNNKKHQNFLWDLQYYNTELFQIKIYEFIVNGFFDSDFNNIAFKYNEKFKKGTKQNNFYETWKVYFHGSFNDDGDDVVSNIYDKFIDGVEVLTPSDFQGTYRLLNDYDANNIRANEIMKLYFNTHKDNKEMLESPFINEEIKEFFKKSLEEIWNLSLPSLEEAVKIFLKNNLDPHNNKFLSKVKMNDFYNYFKKSQISNFSKIEVSRKFKHAEDAIKKIRDESKINQLRIDYLLNNK